VLEGLQKAGTLTGRWDLGRVGVGVVVREGAARPDLSTPEAFKQALLSARSIALTDPAVGGTAGIYVAGLIERLGLADALKAKTLLQRNGFYVAQAVASGEAEIGMTQMSEIVAVKGAAVAGPLPPPLQVVTTYSVSVFSASKAKDMARAFIQRLTDEALADHWNAAGFEPPEA
jgi:molybdate transport system substrate-binding protein